MSLSGRQCRMSEASCKRLWIEAWVKPPTARYGKNSSSACRHGEFRLVERTDGRAAPQYTTAEMIRLEREIVGSVRVGNQQRYENSMLVSPALRIRTEDLHPELSKSQLAAVDEIFLSREKIVGLDGVAGAGKTTTLAVIREGVEAQGYQVEGFAPTSRAAQKLAEAGMRTSTLQHHLARGEQRDTGEKRLYVLDESSLASTRQMHEFMSRLHRNDRVLLVGDIRQHEGVEAGRPFAQLQEAGMHTVKLDEILRQRDPELKQAVELLAHGHVAAAVESLDQQGRVHEVKGREDRITAIAREYAASPESTLVVSPDNRSRVEINSQIHKELQGRGIVDKQEHTMRVLAPRQEMTGADRSWAQRYQIDDILHYSRASKETGIGKGEYARVIAVHSRDNLLTVLRGNGEQITYDPRRQMGVSVYRAQEKAFSVGDRVQFTAPNQELKVANRELGSIESIAPNGPMRLKLDSGRSVEFAVQRFPHLDHGYAVTSHSSQGQTAERVLIHVDTELGAKDLLNHRMAYVSVSRGQWDAQIFTNDREKLSQALSHDVSHKSALSARTSDAWGAAEDRPVLGACAGAEHGVWIGFVKKAKFSTEGADDAGIQQRVQEATSTSHHSARGEAAGQPGRGGPATFHQPAWTRLPDSESETAN